MQNDARVPTMNDVARTAGVSSATVSRVINGTGKVDKDTRQRVAEAIERLGYTPNFGGRFLAAGRSGTIGAVIPT
ncbi:MAG: LacI family DNA-binding transcriptional regulator, partial [Paracoccus sp. (in: a-proteobacteria)]